MKLSEAIREGAKKRPQAFGAYFKRDNNDILCSCALGAAYENLRDITRPQGLSTEDYLIDSYPWLADDINERCPTEDCSSLDADAKRLDVVAHLNDEHKWTREAIADWLESQGY